MPTDAEWMERALDRARDCLVHDDVPIGAVVVRGDEEIAAGGNERELRGDATAHAEVLAIRAASEALGSWRLEGCTLYVTLEPCAMCAGALVNARIARLVYGCDDLKAGAVRSLFTIGQDARLNHRFEVQAGVLAEQCAQQLSSFFAALREGRPER